MKRRLPKSALIAGVAGRQDLPGATVERVLDDALAAIADAVMAGSDVILTHFGTFTRRDLPERMTRNPATGGQQLSPARSLLAFRASKAAP